jgi:hypothetical protein
MEKIESNEQEKTIVALLAKIKELEEENQKLRNALVYNWLNAQSASSQSNLEGNK